MRTLCAYALALARAPHAAATGGTVVSSPNGRAPNAAGARPHTPPRGSAAGVCTGLGVRVASWGRCAEGLGARHACCRRQPWQAELLRAFSAHETELTWDDVRWRGPAPKRVGAAAQCMPAGAAVLGPADRSRKSGCRVRHRAGRVPHNGCQARRAEGRRRRPNPPRLWFVCLFVCLLGCLFVCLRRRADGAHLLRHAHRPNRLQHGWPLSLELLKQRTCARARRVAPWRPHCALVARTHERAARLEESPHLPDPAVGDRMRPTDPAG
jgi:hypothetical protein